MAFASQLVENTVLQVAQQLEAQIDGQLNKLDSLDEDELEQLRQRRLQHLKRQAEKRQEWLAKGHGHPKEASNEKEIFELMKGEERLVILFYKSNVACNVMSSHITAIAQKHLETLFVKIDAEKAPFLTTKLKIWMLPTLALISNEKVVDYVVGLDELGGTYDFDTEALEDRLAAAGALYERVLPQRAARPAEQHRKVRQGSVKKSDSDEDSDFD